jgi:hypothetical protein
MTVRLPDTSIWGGYAGINPRDPFDPSQPDHLGRPDIVMSYQSSLEDRVLALALRAAAAATPTAAVPLPKPRPRVPDESPAYYLNRTAEASPARPVEHQWMLADPRIGQNQAAPDLNGDPDSPASFDERWMSENPWQRRNRVDPNLLRRPLGRADVPSAPSRTEPSEAPLPKPRPTPSEFSPEIAAALEHLDPIASQMWSENALALRAQGIEIKISSGFRSRTHNAKVPGAARNSQHLYGKATDIPLSGLSLEQKQAVVSQFLSDPRVKGFGYYPDRGAIHVDVRAGGRSSWGVGNKGKSIGEGWPKWMTDQVREWLRTRPPRLHGNDALPIPLPRARP